MSAETKNEPYDKATSGRVKIPLWRNETEDGDPYLSPDKPEFSYRDKEGNWRTSERPAAADLLHLAFAAWQAHGKIESFKSAKSKIHKSLQDAA